MAQSLFQKVLVLVNGTEASINAVRYGVLLSKMYRCTLKAIYVVDTATLKKLTLSKIFIEEESLEYKESLTSDGSKYLKYVQELGKSKGIPIETELLSGSVWGETVQMATDINADLILLGGFDKEDTSFRDALFSNYNEILKNADCSVLMVRSSNIEKLYKMA